MIRQHNGILLETKRLVEDIYRDMIKDVSLADDSFVDNNDKKCYNVDMKYYHSTEHNINIRTDADNNTAYTKKDGEEIVIPSGSKLLADAIIENNQITQEQYDKDCTDLFHFKSNPDVKKPKKDYGQISVEALRRAKFD